MSNDSDPYRASQSFGQEPPRTSGKAIASLVCGLSSFMCCITGIVALVLGMMGLGDIKRSDGRVTGQGLAIGGIVTGLLGTVLNGFFAFGILMALLLPAVTAARSTARRTVSMNHLKQIGVALHAYQADHGHFPWAAGGEEGQPPASWRVRILPYLEHKALFDQYHFDEPWNSEHNRTLVDLMPDVFKSPEDEHDSTDTTVVAVVGDDTMWPEGRATKIPQIRDGLSNTIMCIEAKGLHIPWTEPRDMPIDDFAKGINLPGGPEGFYPGILIAAFADGAVIAIDDDTSAADLRAMATSQGNEAVSPHGHGH